jgi:hypothetical protein
LHTGAFSSAAAQRKPLIITVKGIKVAFLSYTELTNGIQSPYPWSVNRACGPADPQDQRQASRVRGGQSDLKPDQRLLPDGFAGRDDALLTITVNNHGARVSDIHYVPIWVRHPDYVVLPAGVAWHTDPADSAALRASYERTVSVVGRSRQIQPIPAHLG